MMTGCRVPLARFASIALAAFALAAGTAAGSAPAVAQAVVATVDGAPITAFDIDQHIRITLLSARKKVGREEALKTLIDDRVKVAEARRAGYRISDANIDDSVERIARANRQSPDQFVEALRRAGISPQVYRARMEAEIAWEALLRNRLRAGINLTNAEVDAALEQALAKGADKVTDFTLRSVIFVVPASGGAAAAGAQLRAATAARARFKSCEQSLPELEQQRDVAVRGAVVRSSKDLSPQLAAVLAKQPANSLSPPERTAQGIELIAICEKTDRSDRNAARAAVEDELRQKKSGTVAEDYLKDLRAKANIVRR